MEELNTNNLTTCLVNTALKFHPDRNPGKEGEFVTKFQSIQAAHEILGDSQQRTQYDVERIRHGYAYQYTDAASSPASFRRTAPNASPRAAASSGFSRKAAPTASPRAAASSGFSRKAAPTASPRAAASSGFSRKAAPSASPRFNSSNPNNTTPETPKTKQKFAPRSAGDEPMARSTSSYSHGSSRTTSKTVDDHEPPRDDERSATMPGLYRPRRQYAHLGGERTNISDASLGRSSSPRTPCSCPEDTIGHDQSRSTTAPSASSSSSKTTGPHRPRPTLTPKSRLASNQRPSAAEPFGMASGFQPAGNSAAPSSGEFAEQWKESQAPSAGEFSAEQWMDSFKNLSLFTPTPEPPRQHQANDIPLRGGRWKQGANTRRAPQAPTVSTEAEEEYKTVSAGDGNENGEAMDLDDGVPAASTDMPGYNSVSNSSSGFGSVPRRKKVPKSAAMPNNNHTTTTPGKEDYFNLKGLRNVSPFTGMNGATNNNGMDDLADIAASLPSQSRATMPIPGTAATPRDPKCPIPPKSPLAPPFEPASAGSTQLALSWKAWKHYVREMQVYMREWKEFNRRIIAHFSSRQEAVETGLSLNWIDAVGDSTCLPIDGADGGGDDLIAGTAKGGYQAYLRAIEEDKRDRTHWGDACHKHEECIYQLGALRDRIKNGVVELI